MGAWAPYVPLMLVLAAALQVAAAVVALALIPLSDMRLPWIAVAVALLLQAVRRVYLIAAGTTPGDAALALLISVLLLAGVIGMRFVFLSMRRTESLLDAEREYQDTFEGRAGALVVLLDPEGRIQDVNERACQVLECDPEYVQGRQWFDMFTPAAQRRDLYASFRRLVKSDDEDEYVEYEAMDMAGRPHTIVWHRRLLRDDGGKVIGVRSAGIDLTERHALEQELAFRSLLLDHTNDAVLVYDGAGNVQYANDRARLYRGGRGHDVVVGADMHDLLPPEERAAFEVHIDTVGKGACTTFETTGLGTDGRVRTLESHTCPVTLNGRQLVLEVARDVTDRREAESAIRRMAYSDPLTGLGNRVVLVDRAQVAMAHARRTGRSLAVLFLDLDAMKAVNDGYGHAAGDELLQQIGGRLSDAFRGEDTVARIGGDEFVVLAGIESAEQAAGVARRVEGLMSKPFRLEAGEIEASFSVGVAVFPHDGEEFDQLLGMADAVMYEVKARNRASRRRAAGA